MYLIIIMTISTISCASVAQISNTSRVFHKLLEQLILQNLRLFHNKVLKVSLSGDL